MRKLVAPVLCTFLMITGISALTACTGSASIGAGANTPPPPPPPPPATPPPPPPPPAAAPEFKMEGNKLALPGAIVFETGKAAIKTDDQGTIAVLDLVKAYLDAKPNVTKLRIEGHTDNVGDAKKNLELSGLRALAVAKYLVAKGIDCKRLTPTGFGDTRPVADNKTEDGRAQNRRTDFINAELKGKAIMGLPVDGSAPVSKDACAQ